MHAVTHTTPSCSTVARWVRRRSRHWSCSTLSSSSAMLNQLPSLRMWWTSILGRRAFIRSSASESRALCTFSAHSSPIPRLVACVARKFSAGPSLLATDPPSPLFRPALTKTLSQSSSRSSSAEKSHRPVGSRHVLPASRASACCSAAVRRLRSNASAAARGCTMSLASSRSRC